MVFSPNSQLLALSVSETGTDTNGNPTSTSVVKLWQTTSHQFAGQPWPFTHSPATIGMLAFSPDGKMLAGAGCSTYTAVQQNLAGEIWLWDVATGHADRLAWSGHAGCVQDIAFSPDGKLLAAGVCLNAQVDTGNCGQPEVQIWDMVHRRPLGQPITGDFGDVYGLWISPDGKMLAAQVENSTTGTFGGGTIVWDIATHRQVQTGPAGRATGDISGDWSLMATAMCSPTLSDPARCDDYDGAAIELRDLREDHTIGVPLAAHGIGGTRGILFGPDHKTLVSWSPFGGSLLVWDINPASWATRICQIVGRNLTRDEWNRYLTTQEPYRPTCPTIPLAPTT
jgi:WD40 repeat protein